MTEQALSITNLWKNNTIFFFIIKSPNNARSDWPKQRALSEIWGRVDDSSWL